MDQITGEILLILMLTVFNGFFALSEIAVVSARRSRLQQWADAGDRGSDLALKLSRAPDRFLSTVQVGITLVGVLAGAFGGTTIAQQAAAALSRSEVLAPYAETIAMTTVVLGITFLNIVLGELAPKRIALRNPERISAFIAAPMGIVSRLAAPVVWLLGRTTDALLWIFRVRKEEEVPLTDEEIKILLRQSAEAGGIHRDEQEIVERALRLRGRRAGTIMTPRRDLVTLDVADSPTQVLAKVSASGFALYPLCDGTLDNVVGVVRTQDILSRTLAGKPWDLRAIVREPLFFSEAEQSLALLREFKRMRKDTALLLDEYGVLRGMITAADVLKGLVGELSHLIVPKATRRGDGSWLIDGMLPLDEFRDALRFGDLPVPERGSYETVGGLVMALMGRVPTEGDHLVWGPLRLEIVDMDGLRIDKVLVTPRRSTLT